MGSPDLTNEEIEALLNNSDESNGDKDQTDDKIEEASSKKRTQKVLFPEVEESEVSSDGNSSNLNLLMDVPLEVAVEIGRTKKSVQEVLSLNIGSVIELNKLSGEPVDLLVNGKVIAHAEVVIIDENFGVRITEIIKPKSRIEF